MVNVPSGGIFSDEAAGRIREEKRAAWAKRQAEENEAAAKKKAEEDAVVAREWAAEKAAAATAFYVCTDKLMCSKVFALAQIYVARNADQKIQVATDTIIETYNPTEDGKIGMSVTKTPRHGSTEIVSIAPSCKDSDRHYASICRRKRTQIYSGFQPFVDSQLSK